MNERKKYTIENELYCVNIFSYGAELCSFRNKQNGREYIWQGDPSVWPDHAPLLFPIVGRLRNDSYTLYEKQYHMEIHGFARKSEFEVMEKSDGKIVFRLLSSDITYQAYPFDFELISEYELIENTLAVTRKVRNLTEQIMPYSIGEHIGIRIPIESERKLDDYIIKLEYKETIPRWPLVEGHLLGAPEPFLMDTDEIRLTQDLFQEDALVFENARSKMASIVDSNGEYDVSVAFQDYETIAFWSKPGAGYVCIEPWNGYDTPVTAGDDLLAKPGIRLLQPHAEERFKCSICINKG